MKILYFVFHCKMICNFFYSEKNPHTNIFFVKNRHKLKRNMFKAIKEKNRLTDNSITIEISIVSIFNDFQF